MKYGTMGVNSFLKWSIFFFSSLYTQGCEFASADVILHLRPYEIQEALGQVATTWECRWSLQGANNLSFPSAGSETGLETPIFCLWNICWAGQSNPRRSAWLQSNHWRQSSPPSSQPLNSHTGRQEDLVPLLPPTNHISKQMKAYWQRHRKKTTYINKCKTGSQPALAE